jgi:hypothetical protein
MESAAKRNRNGVGIAIGCALGLLLGFGVLNNWVTWGAIGVVVIVILLLDRAEKAREHNAQG